MKKILLASTVSLLGLSAFAQSQPVAGRDGVVHCITRPDGVQQCEGGNYVVPGNRPGSGPGYNPPQPVYNPPPQPYYPPQPVYNPPPPQPYYPPQPVYNPPPPVDPYYPPQSGYNPPPSSNYPGVPSYGLQQFNNDEQEAINWNQRYNQAPSGSWDESYARQNRDQSIQRAMSDISNYSAFDGMSFRDIENFGLMMEQKYNQAPSGSALENLYRQARQIAFNAAVNSFQSEVMNMSQQYLYQIQDEYNQKYNQAPSGSAREQYFRQVRDIARSRLGIR